MTRPTLDISPSQNGKEHFTISPSQNGIEHFTISTIDLIPVGTKTPDPLPQTQPKELPEENGKGHIPDEPDPEKSSSDLSSKKKKQGKKKIFKNTGKMTRQTHH